jgi:hypothetical protein
VVFADLLHFCNHHQRFPEVFEDFSHLSSLPILTQITPKIVEARVLIPSAMAMCSIIVFFRW